MAFFKNLSLFFGKHSSARARVSKRHANLEKNLFVNVFVVKKSRFFFRILFANVQFKFMLKAQFKSW